MNNEQTTTATMLHDRLLVVAAERDALRAALAAVLTQYDTPHGFDSNHWYGRVMEAARAALQAVRS